MKLKIFQLNMWAGMCFNSLKSFLLENNFDILCFQEVAGPQTYFNKVKCEIDCFKELKGILKNTHTGELAVSQYFSSNPKTAYFGNAIFFRNDFKLTKKQIITLYKRTTPYPSDSSDVERIGRTALHVEIIKDGKKLDIVTAHLSLTYGTKIEQIFQKDQNKKLINYISRLQNPFILTGDFNIISTQPTILSLDKFAKNLTKEYKIKNTIDSTIHLMWDKIKPGVAIDYIFVSLNIKVDNFNVLNNTHVSDHLALTADVEI